MPMSISVPKKAKRWFQFVLSIGIVAYFIFETMNFLKYLEVIVRE